MDYFNRVIPDALVAYLDGYVHGGRQSGQTIGMLSTVKRGDAVVVATAQVKAYCEVWLRSNREQGFVEDVKFFVCEATMHELVHRLHGYRGTIGKLHFDHTWIAKFYRHTIHGIRQELEEFTKQVNRVVDEE